MSDPRPAEIYVVFDGQRVAERRDRAWAPLVKGYEVIDAADEIIVFVDGVRVH